MKKFRVLYHLAFWGFFVLLFLQQNPGAGVNDYISWFTVLAESAGVVYMNLYLLLPRYFFKRRYPLYAGLLFVTLASGSLILRVLLYSDSPLFSLSIFQLFVNLFVFVVVTSTLKFYREYSHKQEVLVRVENERLKTELSLLKAHVNPHFLFNTLNNLYGLIVQNRNEQASDVTLRLSDLMRYLLESSKTDVVSLNKEIRVLEDYLCLERIRLNEDVDIRFEVSGTENDVFVAPFLFIPLVENAFKHGLSEVTKGGFAHFSLALQGSDLFFESRSSVGASLAGYRGSGTGLENLRKRLQLSYPGKYRLDIEETSKYYKAVLYVQL